MSLYQKDEKLFDYVVGLKMQYWNLRYHDESSMETLYENLNNMPHIRYLDFSSNNHIRDTLLADISGK